MEIEQRVWAFTPEGEAAILYTMRNRSGAYVELTNTGAAIRAVAVPDRNGVIRDVALGYRSPLSYIGDPAAMGKSVGRYANRIAGGRFVLDGIEHYLAQNAGSDHMHGGAGGFGNRIWESRVEVNRVVFSLLSPDGDQNYPGEMAVEAVYDWDEDNTLEITYLAKSDGATIADLTNHTYFNLAGHDSGSVSGHCLRLNAALYLPTDRMQIPTGGRAPVRGTPMDFTRAKELGKDIGADLHCLAVDGWEKGRLSDVGTLYDPASGRTMDILSTQPGVQVCTGDRLQGCPAGKDGARYQNHSGAVVGCMGFPDAPNHPDFPSQVIRRGELYRQRIVYRFGVGVC